MNTFETENSFGRGKVLSWASILDDSTRLQAEMTSRSPVIDGHLALMPDAHYGQGATVGSVMRMKGGLIPSAIGVDIGCGILSVQTDCERASISRDQERRILGRLRETVPSGVGKNHEKPTEAAMAFFLNGGDPPHLDLIARGRPLGDTAKVQFGTLGSGNHFAEYAQDANGAVWLIVHSGSRALGMATANYYMVRAQEITVETQKVAEHRDLTPLPEGHPDFTNYLTDMLYAQRYAWGQREAMMDRMLEAMRAEVPGGWSQTGGVHCHHNYAEWDPKTSVFTARKGAIAARPGDMGIIPGSMGDSTYIVTGLGLADAYESAPHGSGRVLSRGEARRTLGVEEFRESMADCTWQDRDAEGLIDEAPKNYKPIETVMADAATMVKAVAKLRRFINYKGVDEARGKRRR